MPKYDWGAGTTGALSGAASGSALGSAIPGIGTAIGALGGGLVGLFSGIGRGGKNKLSTMDKRQRGLYQDYEAGLRGTGQFKDLFGFDPDQTRDTFSQMYAQPAYQQFQEEVIPGITGAFRGRNLQNSSYLGGALAKAGTNVQNNLNAQLAQILQNAQQSSIDRRLSGLRDMLGMQTFAYQKPQQSPLDSILGGFSQGAGQFLANRALGSGQQAAPASQSSLLPRAALAGVNAGYGGY